MRNQFENSIQVCKRILEGMGVDAIYCNRKACFHVDDDLWRVEIDLGPDQVGLSFAREMEPENVAWAAMRFYGLASMIDLEIVSVGSHEREQFTSVTVNED